MSDDKPQKKHGTDPLVLGKKSRTEQFSTVKTAEQVQEEQDINKEHDAPDAVTLEAYFSLKGIRNPTKRAMMVAYTKVKRATVAAFDEIFSTF